MSVCMCVCVIYSQSTDFPECFNLFAVENTLCFMMHARENSGKLIKLLILFKGRFNHVPDGFRLFCPFLDLQIQS